MHFREARAALAAALGALIAAAPMAAAAEETQTATPAPATTYQLNDPAQVDKRWHAYVTPYLWLPTIKGELNFNIPANGNSFGLTVVPSQYVPKLASALMFTGGVRKGNWGAVTDLVYLNLTGATAGVTSVTGPDGMETVPINTNVQARLSAAIWTLAGTYNALPGKPGNLDAVLGFRYATWNPQVSWNFSGPFGLFPIAGRHSENVNLWDGIAGVKGKFDFSNSKWYAPFYADIGTGEAQLTWQVAGGIGMQSHSNAWSVGYRNLYYNMGAGHLLHNFNLGGPYVGYTFKF
jgi:hypothetical protein